ncbi:MAG TPA: phosphoribosylanthranilate isomerase [Steroidobacteraceae bacterium]|jgi:phosphoribosylanthranilate isomerase|nr:phosphoribosylanthranilate isomerase [Steroidobacteraceae bacterium]
MWVKICGLTTPDALAAAVEAGADALGFVFAASVRQLTPQAAAQLARPVRGRLRCVAVTHHPEQRSLDEMLKVFRPDVLQSDAPDLATLTLPTTLELLPVVRSGESPPAPLPARILFEGPVSGTGNPGDWAAARRLRSRTELVLAGGLDVVNVAAAIAAVRPFGVDVSSGVEARPGVKNPLKIQQFIAAARAAAATLPRDES